MRDRWLEIRQRFLKKEVDAELAELRVLESEAEQRRRLLGPKVKLAQREVSQLEEKFRLGAVIQQRIKPLAPQMLTFGRLRRVLENIAGLTI